MQEQNNFAWIGLVFIIIATGAVVWWGATRLASGPGTGTNTSTAPITTADPLSLPGVSENTAPWPVELANLKARLAADNLPALATEGTVLHIHQHLDIYVHGRPVPVPADIGVDEASDFISPVHTHDTAAILHVESPYAATFTLGEFFDIWGVRFTSDCLGGYCSDASSTLRVYVNGEPYQGDPRQLALASHQEIAIVFGTATEKPAVIPVSYTFPSGY